MKSRSKLLCRLMILVMCASAGALAACSGPAANTSGSGASDSEMTSDGPVSSGESDSVGGSSESSDESDDSSVSSPDEWEGYTKISGKADFLNFVGNASDGKYVLVEDIVFSESDEVDSIPLFSGEFEGNGKTLKGLRCYDGSLFGKLSGATVRNLRIENAEVSSGNMNAVFGLLAAEAENSVVDCVDISGKVVGVSGSTVGGGVGKASGSVVSNVAAEVAFEGKCYLGGGIVGEAKNSSVYSCKAGVDGSISADAFGGAVGKKDAETSLFNIVVDNRYSADAKKAGAITADCTYDEYTQPSGVVACYYLKAAADNGFGTRAAEEDIPDYFNPDDWRDGKPVLSAAKTHGKVTVTIDSVAEEREYGSFLSDNSFEGDGVVVDGYLLNGERVSLAMPLVSDMALTTNKADYSAYAGVWVSSGTGERIVYGEQFGIYNYEGTDYGASRLCVREESGDAVLYFRLRTSVFNVSYNAAYGMLEVKSGSTLASRFMPVVDDFVGAVELGGEEYVLSSEVRESASGGYGFSCLHNGVSDVFTTKLVKSEDGNFYEATVGGRTLSDRSVSAGRETLLGVWTGNGYNVTVGTDAVRINGTSHSYTAELTEYGAGLKLDNGDVLVATLTGVAYYTSGTKNNLVGSIADQWIAVVDGRVYDVYLGGEGEDIVINDRFVSDYDVSPDGGTIVFEYLGEEVTIAFSAESTADGSITVGSVSGLLVKKSVLEQFVGRYTAGSQGFEISEDGTITELYYGSAGESHGFTLGKNSTLGYYLAYDDVKIYIHDGRKTVSGLYTYIYWDMLERDYTLYTFEEYEDLMARLAGTYHNGRETVEIGEDYRLYYKPVNSSYAAAADYFIESYEDASIRFTKKSTWAAYNMGGLFKKLGDDVAVLYDGYSADVYVSDRINNILGSYAQILNEAGTVVTVRTYNSTLQLIVGSSVYTYSQMTVADTEDGVSISAGGCTYVFENGTITADGKKYYANGILPYTLSSDYYYNVKGEYLLCKTSVTASEATVAFHYGRLVNGSVSATISDSVERTAEGTYLIGFPGIEERLELVIEDNYSLTFGGVSYYYAGGLYDISKGNYSFINASDSIRFREGKIIYNGKTATIVSAETATDGTVTFVFDAADGRHTAVYGDVLRFMVDDRPFVIDFLSGHINLYVNPETGNRFSISEDGELTYGGVSVKAYAVNDSNFKFYYYTGHATYDFVVDYAYSTSYIRLTDYIHDTNADYYTEAYAVYGGIYRTESGKYISVEANRILYGGNNIGYYSYNSTTRTITASGVSFVINADGTISYDGETYVKADVDISRFFGTVFYGGTSITLSESDFTDGTIKGYIWFNGDVAVYYGFNRIVYINNDDATKGKAPILMISSARIAYLGEYTYKNAPFVVDYEPYVTTSGNVEVRIFAVYGGERIDLAFDAYDNRAEFTLGGSSFVLEKDRYGSALILHDTTYRAYENVYTVNGVHYGIYYAPKAEGGIDASIAVYILDENYKPLKKCSITGTTSTSISFIKDGKTYIAKLNSSLSTVTVLRSELNSYVTATKTIGTDKIRLGYSINDGVAEVTVTFNGSATAVTRAYLLQDDDAKVIFLANGTWYLLDTEAGTLTVCALTEEQAATFDLIGTYYLQNSTLYPVSVYLSGYDAAAGAPLLKVRTGYAGRVVVTSSGVTNGIVTFTVVLGDAEEAEYVIYNGSPVLAKNYRLAGEYTVGGKALSVTLDAYGFVRYSYDGSAAAYPYAVAADGNSFTIILDGGKYIMARTDAGYDMAEAVSPLHDMLGSYIPTFTAYYGEDSYAPLLNTTYVYANGGCTYTVTYVLKDEYGRTTEIPVSFTERNGTVAFVIDDVTYYAVADGIKGSALPLVSETVYEYAALSDDALQFVVEATYRESEVSDGDDEYTVVTVGVSYYVVYEGVKTSAAMSGDGFAFGTHKLIIEDGALKVV